MKTRAALALVLAPLVKAPLVQASLALAPLLLASMLLASLLLLPGCSNPPQAADNKARVAALYDDLKRKNFPDVTDVSPEEVLAWQASGVQVVFLDVRPEKERAVGIIPGALTEAELAARLNAPDPSLANARIVAYCTISFRSASAVNALRARGLPAFNLRGGLLGWTHAGGPLADAAGPTKRAHVYSKSWNYLPDDYKPVW